MSKNEKISKLLNAVNHIWGITANEIADLGEDYPEDIYDSSEDEVISDVKKAIPKIEELLAEMKSIITE